MKTDDGGQAFPRAMGNAGHVEAFDQGQEGMTLRDYFATHAPPMPPAMVADAHGECTFNIAVDSDRAAYLSIESLWRYEYADAMLIKRRECTE